MRKEIIERSEAMLPRIVAIRRDLHTHPELSFQEERTSRVVQDFLQALGLEVQGGIATTGVVAVLRGAHDGKTIALRADMDALPIVEDTGFPFASKTSGVMHACGHDGHVAMCLGAAAVLTGLRAELKGNVKFIFQPAEEGLGGGKSMVEAGVLESDPRAEAAFALHMNPNISSGSIALRAGPMMASADKVVIDIKGRGGHGAAPHVTVDPVVVSAQVITALQTIVSRQVNPHEPVVLSICKIEGGTTFNVIPESVQMLGTVRTLDQDTRESLPERIEAIIKGVTAASGATYDFTYSESYPLTVNDEQFVELVKEVTASVLGNGRIVALKRPFMGSEDFSYYLQRVPGVFCFLGGRREGREPHPIHHPRFDFDEAAMAEGVKLLAATAIRFLNGTLDQT